MKKVKAAVETGTLSSSALAPGKAGMKQAPRYRKHCINPASWADDLSRFSAKHFITGTALSRRQWSIREATRKMLRQAHGEPGGRWWAVRMVMRQLRASPELCAPPSPASCSGSQLQMAPAHRRPPAPLPGPLQREPHTSHHSLCQHISRHPQKRNRVLKLQPFNRRLD